MQASNTVGQTLQVPIRIVDNGDSNSFANVLANVTVVAATPWQNPINAADVNRDGIVTNSDALLIINRLNDGRGARPLSVPRAFSDLSLGDIDSTGDNFLSPADALRVINALNANRPGGEGESSSSLSSAVESPAAWLLAYNQLEDEAIVRRKR